jgi:hypothetical protein
MTNEPGNAVKVSDERLAQLIDSTRRLEIGEYLSAFSELQSLRRARSSSGVKVGYAVPRSQWGAEAWEILFGLMKGAVPEEVTDEVLQSLAESLIDVLTAIEPGEAGEVP